MQFASCARQGKARPARVGRQEKPERGSGASAAEGRGARWRGARGELGAGVQCVYLSVFFLIGTFNICLA